MEEEIFQVEYVFGKRVEGSEPEYYTKWLNYPKSHCTWEPLSNLERNNIGTIMTYEQAHHYQLCYKLLENSQKKGDLVHINGNEVTLYYKENNLQNGNELLEKYNLNELSNKKLGLEDNSDEEEGKKKEQKQLEQQNQQQQIAENRYGRVRKVGRPKKKKI